MVKITGKIKYYAFLAAVLLLAGCANQLAPGGGEIDRIPPEIVEVYPANGTTGFNDKYIEFGFSEYVDHRTAQDAVFISPAPEGTPEYDWSGRYLRIYFPGKLKDSTTYVVTVGTDVVDLNNKNRMASAYSLTFSTGSKIDKRIVTGRIYEPKPSGIYLFAYRLDNKNPADTLLNKKPDYISQAGTDGSFKVAGLAAGTYRIFAVKDEYSDMIFQAEQDKIGMPYTDVVLSEKDTLFSNLNYFLMSADTTAPRIINAVMTDNRHILVNMTEEFDSTYIRASNFYLFDSTANAKRELKYGFKGNTKPTEFVLVTKDTLPSQNSIFLIADSMADREGNKYKGDFTQVTITEKPDTSAPTVIKTLPQANSEADFTGEQFFFQFNDAFDSTAIKNGVSFTDTSGNAIPFSYGLIDDGMFYITPTVKLGSKKDYQIKLNFKLFADASGNKMDSVYTYKFKTISGLDFTGASGELTGIEGKKNVQIVLQSAVEEKKKYKKPAGKSGKFNFDRVQPGKYLLWAYEDRDSTGTYSKGYPFPYKPAGEFGFYPDTLNLRPRWSQGDIKFNFKKK
jgi:uncharacterized protein (DUF2141 family)